jgi:glycine/D-amino acid oxidase-like deaminating enzyme
MTSARGLVAVIGGGIIGCLAARRLAGLGRRVVLLERDAIGSGASRRSVGLHLPRGAHPEVRAMAADSQSFYERLRAARPGVPIHPVPMRLVVPAVADAYLHAVHLPTARLARAEPPPSVLVPPGGAVWSVQGGQYADVAGLVAAVREELPAEVTVREGIGVRGVTAGRSGVRLGLSAGPDLDVDAVVLAPGPWLTAPAWRGLLEPVGARVKKIVALFVDQAPGPGAGVIVFPEEDAFLLPRPDLRGWLFSYTCDHWDVGPDDVAPTLSGTDLADGVAVLRRYAPALAAEVSGARVFCDAYAPDRIPVVRPVDEHRRVVFAGAANGSGYRLAPAIAARAAQLVTARLDDRSST